MKVDYQFQGLKMTKYLIKRSKKEYELLKPEDTPMRSGQWETVFSERYFPDFYYRLISEIFPEIGEDDHFLYSSISDITIAERACVDHVSTLYKAMNSAKRTLVNALENPESLDSLLI